MGESDRMWEKAEEWWGGKAWDRGWVGRLGGQVGRCHGNRLIGKTVSSHRWCKERERERSERPLSVINLPGCCWCMSHINTHTNQLKEPLLHLMLALSVLLFYLFHTNTFFCFFLILCLSSPTPTPPLAPGPNRLPHNSACIQAWCCHSALWHKGAPGPIIGEHCCFSCVYLCGPSYMHVASEWLTHTNMCVFMTTVCMCVHVHMCLVIGLLLAQGGDTN